MTKYLVVGQKTTYVKRRGRSVPTSVIATEEFEARTDDLAICKMYIKFVDLTEKRLFKEVK